MQYSNFDLELFDYAPTADGASLRVRVANSPKGGQTIDEARQGDPIVIDSDLARWIRQLEARTFTTMEELIRVGTALGDILLPAKTRELFLDSRDIVCAQNQRLRLRLRIGNRELTQFPWEYAYIPREDTTTPENDPQGFLALDQSVSIVRFEQFIGTINKRSALDRKIRMVALMSSPVDDRYPALQLETETVNLKRALEGVDGVESEIRTQASVTTLQEVLRTDAHIFHFAGHGEFDVRTGVGSILLEDGTDRHAVPLEGNVLATNLAGSHARLAVLGACNSGRRDGVNGWSGVAASLVHGGIPAVVGMQFKVEDRNAITFSSAFYGALADGQPIDYALTRARIAVFTDTRNTNVADRDWGVAVLYLRVDDADDCVLFPRAEVGNLGSSWDDVLTLAEVQSDRFLNDAQGTEARRGNFRPELYVTRADAEGKLNAFLNESSAGLLLLGESGAGKTNVLCKWATEARAAKHAVFIYHCGAMVDTDIEREIARDLELDGAHLNDGFERIERLSGNAGRKFVLIFDALNVFRGDAKQSTVTLLLRINALINRLPADTNIRVVIACSSVAWNIMQRRQQPTLAHSRYAMGRDGEIAAIMLGRFSSAELEQAYARYQNVFVLKTALSDLPVRIREQIAAPYLLRMLAETSGGDATTSTQAMVDDGLVKTYYERRVRRPEDRGFLKMIVQEMYVKQASFLPTEDLMEHADLGKLISEDDTESSWCVLLNEGVLFERDGGSLTGKLAGFTFPSVGSYVLAKDFAKRGITAGLLAELVDRAGKFPLAWEAARIVLANAPAESELTLLTELANSNDPECRELVVSSLVERYAAQGSRTKQIIRSLLATGAPSAQRTALKAAYSIGADARDIFVEAAERGDEGLRAAVKDTLYLIWRNESPATRRSATDTLYLVWRRNPGFTLAFLRDLLSRIGLWSLLTRRYVGELFVELSVTIYINHCENPEVIAQTAQLYRDLSERLSLPGLVRNMDRGSAIIGAITPEAARKFLFDILMSAFAGPIVDAMFPKGLMPEKNFFDASAESRRVLLDIALYLDPAANLCDARATLGLMFKSDQQVYSLAAALTLSVHLTHNFVATAPIVRELFGAANETARLWILFSFCVLLPATPPEWGALSEELTTTFLQQHPDAFWKRTSPLLNVLDFLLVPAGLAAGKAGQSLTFVKSLLAERRASMDVNGMARLLDALAPVGFHYPEPVLELLRTDLTPDEVRRPEVWPSMCKLLGVMRTLHLDLVDGFLLERGIDDALRSSVAAEADVDVVHMYVSSFGYFNNAVHFSANYPWMREVLSQGALRKLAVAPNRKHFVSGYAMDAFRMFADANFDLIRWTTNDRPQPVNARR